MASGRQDCTVVTVRRYGGDDEPVKVWFVGWVDAEGNAHMLRYWSPLLVPGIVQTPEYSYEVFRAGGRSHELATEDTNARMQRQSVLNRVDPANGRHRTVGTGSVSPGWYGGGHARATLQAC